MTAWSPNSSARTRCCGLKARVAVTNPRTTRRLTDPFRVLFRPVIASVVVVGFVAVVAWVFFDRGLAASAYDAFERPHLLLLVFVVSVLSGGFHEFGHAAAARYSGAQPGTMGAGLYLVWPAFYTDVTDSYRLPRGGRIRTDLGGLYFNAIVVVLTFAWWWATGWEALLLLVGTQVLQMVQQLLPLFRFDGYHLLADIAGVPDLYRRIKPTLAGLLPHRWSSGENRVLTPPDAGHHHAVGARDRPHDAADAACPHRGRAAAPRHRRRGDARGRRRGSGCLERQKPPGRLRPRPPAPGRRAPGAGLCPDPQPRGAALLPRPGAVEPRLRRQAGGRRRARRHDGDRHWPGPGGRTRATTSRSLPGERGNVTSFLQLSQTAGSPSVLPRTASVVPADAEALRTAATQTQNRLLNAGPLVAAFEEGAELPTKDDPQLALVLIPTHTQPNPGADTAPTPASPSPRRPRAPAPPRPAPRTPPRRTSPGSSPSTSRCRPRRATTRRSRW